MKYKFLLLTLCSFVILSACGGSGTTETQTSETTQIEVSDVVFAKSLGENMEPVDPTDTFYPNEPVNVSVVINGRPKSGVVTGNFYYGDQFIAGTSVDLGDTNSGVIFSIGQDTYVGFTLSHDTDFPVSDQYFIEVLINDQKLGDYRFAVVEP